MKKHDALVAHCISKHNFDPRSSLVASPTGLREWHDRDHTAMLTHVHTSDSPDLNCITRGDGECISDAFCMHTVHTGEENP